MCMMRTPWTIRTNSLDTCLGPVSWPYIMKYHRLGGLNKMHLFSHSSGSGSPIQGTAWSVSVGKGSSLTCRRCLLCILRERESKLSGVPSCKSTNPIMRFPPSWPHLTLITSKRPQSPPTITLEFRASTEELVLWRAQTLSL